jgi:hypothetical protein
MVSSAAAGAGWTAAQTAIVVVALIAFVSAIVSASTTYWFNQRAARRERRSAMFAEALATVEEYVEMPYRIRRRPRTAQARYELTDQLSRLQSRLAFHQALLQMESPEIAVAYADLVRTARMQAGAQMNEAWRQPVLTTDTAMNLGVRYPREEIDAARMACLLVMRGALHARGRAAALPPAGSPTADPGKG